MDPRPHDRRPGPGPRTGTVLRTLTVLGLGLTVAVPAARQLGPTEALELMKLERQAEYSRKRAQCDGLRLRKELEPAIRCLDELISMGYHELLQPNLLQPQDVAVLQELRATLDKQREEERQRQAFRQQFQRVFDQARQARNAGDYRRAKTLIEDALKRNPQAAQNPEFQREFNLVQADYWDYMVRLGVQWTVGALVASGGLFGVFRALRRRRNSSPGSLEVLEGSQPGEVFALGKDRVVLGTSPTDADVRIVDLGRRVSRIHCEIIRQGRAYFVTDLSSNGTTLNGRPLERGQPHPLRPGDVIGLADDIRLRFGH